MDILSYVDGTHDHLRSRMSPHLLFFLRKRVGLTVEGLRQPMVEENRVWEVDIANKVFTRVES